MGRKDLLTTFRAAPWPDRDAVNAFIIEAGDVTTEEILKLLEIVANPWLAQDAARQELRCVAFLRLVEPLKDRSLFVPFVKALRAADPSLRATLVAVIPSVNSPQDHAELCELMANDNPAVRQTAAQVLRRVGSRTALEALGDMLVRPIFPWREDAMELLVGIGGHHAIPALGSMMKVGAPNEKIRAIGHLVSPACIQHDAQKVLEALVPALSDPTEAVRIEALTAFAAHATESQYFERAGALLEDPNVNVAQTVLLGLRYHCTPRSIEALSRALAVAPKAVRLSALDVLESFGTGEALRPLVAALGHRDLAVRVRAAECLSRLACAGRIELPRTVLWLLRSTDVTVRRMALEVARAVPDPDAQLWPQLLDYVYDEDWWVRERVMDTLIDIAGQQLLPRLLEHLRDDTDTVRRYFAVETLRRLRAPEALPALIKMAGDEQEDWLVRERAVEAVAAIGGEAEAQILADLAVRTADVRSACLEALGAMAVRSTAAPIGSLLRDSSLDADTQLAALHALQKLDDPTQASAVQDLLGRTGTNVHDLALELLTRWNALEPQSVEVDATASSDAVQRLLSVLASREGDDLILRSGARPSMKRAGRTLPLAHGVLTEEEIAAFVLPQMTGRQLADFEARRDVDFSYELGDGPRFRVHVFRQASGLSAVVRIIRGGLPSFTSLGLPPVVGKLGDLRNGLVLIGGPTGSGKSTTLAALVDYINATTARHIICLEDPIEVVHARHRGLVTQREAGTHFETFVDALPSTLRQDPDVILLGEMRDYPTIAFGISAAETGHLVFGTIHTVTAATTVDRLINACPPAQQNHVRAMLAGCLRAVVCQYLHSRRDAPGRVVSAEVMLNNEAIAQLIRQGKTHQLPSAIMTAQNVGMQTMDNELMRLVREGKISAEDAYVKAASKKEFAALLAPAENVRQAGQPA
jgi:twitching motility protein PilT